jgi:hypothetical protein
VVLERPQAVLTGSEPLLWYRPEKPVAAPGRILGRIPQPELMPSLITRLHVPQCMRAERQYPVPPSLMRVYQQCHACRASRDRQRIYLCTFTLAISHEQTEQTEQMFVLFTQYIRPNIPNELNTTLRSVQFVRSVRVYLHLDILHGKAQQLDCRAVAFIPAGQYPRGLDQFLKSVGPLFSD